jgi:hypothetical protein
MIVYPEPEMFEMPDLDLVLPSLDLVVQPLELEPLPTREMFPELAELIFDELPELDLPPIELDYKVVELF